MTAATNALAVVRPLNVIGETAAEVDSSVSIIATNVSDVEGAWNSTTTYSVGTMVQKNYKTYKCVLPHINISPEAEGALTASPPIWQRVGWTNSRRAFDNSSTSQTKQATSITYEISSTVACTHVALLGLVDATQARVRVRNPSTSAIVYDKTIALTSVNGLVADQVFSDLTSLAPSHLLIDITGGTNLAVASILFGVATKLGTGVHHGASIQFQDYSRKEVDDFGEVTFVRRAFAKRATFNTMVERADLDSVMTLLASLRARPCLWIGHPNYQMTAIYGFFKDLSMDLVYSTRASLSISIEGMTTRGPTEDPITTPAPPPPTSNAPWVMGVNVHTGGATTTENTQIADLLANRNLHHKVRFNLYYNHSSGVKALARDLIEKLIARGGSAQLIVFTRYQDDHDPVGKVLSTVYTNAYNDAYGLVNEFSDIVTDFEMHNETNLRSEVTADAPWGSQQESTTAYEASDGAQYVKAFMRGVSNAIAQVAIDTSRPLRRIFGFTNRDWGWGTYMLQTNTPAASPGAVNWEVSGWHVYPNLADPVLTTSPSWWAEATNQSPLQRMAQFGKPVTINELNCAELWDAAYNNAEGDAKTEEGFASVEKNLGGLYVQDQCDLESITFYEIFDDAGASGAEAIAGLLYGNTPTATPKTSLYICTAYAGGNLTAAEQDEITVERTFLTDSEIATMKANAQGGPAPAPSPSPAPAPGAEWTPSQIFTTGVKGAWLEPRISSLETTATSGTLITQVGDRVGKWLDLSGNGNHASQTTDASRPYFQYAAGNLPCVDYFNQLGMASTTGGSSTLGTYGCLGIEIPTSTGAVWSNVNAGSTSGIRIVYSSTDGGITLVAGTGSATVSLFQAMPNPPGKCVVQWWHDTMANTINMRVNDNTTKSATLTAMGAGLASFGLGRYPDGANVFNQKIYCHLHTVDHLPSQSNRDQAYAWARRLSGMAESNTDTSTGTFPAKVLGCYYTSWATSTYKITDVPLDFNVIYLFHCKPNGTPVNGNYNNVGNGSFFFEHYAGVPAASIQQCRNRGQKVILTLGGASAGFIFDTRTKSDNLLNSLYNVSNNGIIDQLGGVDGVDFNNYEGGLLTSGNIAAMKTEMAYIATQLRTKYGSSFAITTPASPNEPLDQEMCQYLKTQGLLTYSAPQYYDWTGFNADNYIKSRTDTWVTLMGGDQTKVGVGLSANYPNGPSLSDCIREWDRIKAAYPNIRGMFCWNAQTNLAGGNVWGSTMKARL